MRPSPTTFLAALCLLAAGLALMSCAGETGPDTGPRPATTSGNMEELRMRMVEEQIAARGITNEAVLEAFRTVPRHLFVPKDVQPMAYNDGAQPIGFGQTISQPYIVALMTDLARPSREARVLEVGTGSGYQAAILGQLFGDVYTIEILTELGRRAKRTLADQGYENVQVRVGDGYDGWPEEAPFDAIVVTAAPSTIPRPLMEQLAEGGRLVIPVGERTRGQDLMVLTRHGDDYQRKLVTGVLFVPMTGKAQEE
jgi:protein-L-isoaspartate(D-aspartate) O-methyltransferase